MSLSPQTVETPVELPDLSHVACCTDNKTSLCGLDVTGWPWGPDTGHADCVVCIDLTDHPLCPHTGTPCPW